MRHITLSVLQHVLKLSISSTNASGTHLSPTARSVMRNPE